MSAWDIAGTVVWTPLASALWVVALSGANRGKSPTWCFVALVDSVAVSLAAVYCIARACGAHA